MHFDDDIVWWPIVSSSLWCIDAMCYLKSDIANLEVRKNPMNTRMNINVNTEMQHNNHIMTETVEIV